MSKRATGSEFTMRKRAMGWEFTIKKSDEVRFDYEKKSD